MLAFKMSNRTPIKKSVRFAVFARDGFTCRYCGRKSDEVKLVLDHLIAYSKGGSDTEENLVTSCSECNSGKGVRSATPDPENETVRLSRMQTFREQQEAAEAAVAAVKAEQELRGAVLDAWCDITGRDKADRATIQVVTAYAKDHGLAVVIGWIGKAYLKCGHDDRKMGQYVSGIRRVVEKEASA